MATGMVVADACRRMLRAIESDAYETRKWTGIESFSSAVMGAMGDVPRHVFAGYDARDPGVAAAYANRPAQIGHGQTISQPFIVALMSELLDLKPGDRVLEIGTGCGYQAAVLSRLAKQVYSVERIEALADRARDALALTGCQNVEIKTGDGFEGWPEHAPYDGIVVTAAPEAVPETLKRQLALGGRLVIPIGPVGGPQMLHRLIRQTDGRFVDQGLLPVAFVPMVGDAGA